VLERKGLELVPRGAPVSEMEALADARKGHRWDVWAFWTLIFADVYLAHEI